MLTAGFVIAARERRLSEWWSDYRRARGVLSVRGDWRPSVGIGADLIVHTMRALRRRCSIREATTQDIEWDGESLPEC